MKDFDKLSIPHRPGVYLYKNKEGQVIYVGKAIDLQNRVSQYFLTNQGNIKISSLVSQIAKIETIIVNSELEALILEANLIKKYLPVFNTKLTDDKDYLYIKITKEDFPQVLIARKKDLKGAKKYFGPFPSGKTVKETLKKLRKIFPWCANKKPPFGHKLRPCFYYHLNLCPGACIGKIDKKEYNKIISRLIKLLSGKKEEVTCELEKEMNKFSKNLEFEKAASIKKIVDGINYLTQANDIQAYLENPNFLENEKINSLLNLKNDLNLGGILQKIECYDISNIQGKFATGSLVVLIDGEIDKNWYRRFKIKSSRKANDVLMMKEIIGRRLKHVEWPLPDLILVDGGIAQVRAVHSVICSSLLKIPIFGLAKKMEWLYTPEGKIIKLPKMSKSLLILQRIRDEAHRFALSYHRKLYSIV